MTLSQPLNETPSSVHEVITSGHMLYSLDKGSHLRCVRACAQKKKEKRKSGVGQDLVTCSGQEYQPPEDVGNIYRRAVKRAASTRAHARGIHGVDRQAADAPGTSQSPSGGGSGNSPAQRQSLRRVIVHQCTFYMQKKLVTRTPEKDVTSSVYRIIQQIYCSSLNLRYTHTHTLLVNKILNSERKK